MELKLKYGVNEIKREDFSVQKLGDMYIAYAHFAPFFFEEVQKGKHRTYQKSGKTKEEAIDLLIRSIIKDLSGLVNQ